MARVVIHSQMLSQPRVHWMLCMQSIKEIENFIRRFQHTERLWFQTKMQFPAGLLANFCNVLHATPYILAALAKLFRSCEQLLKPTRNRANATFNANRKHLTQQIKKQVRVSQPLG